MVKYIAHSMQLLLVFFCLRVAVAFSQTPQDSLGQAASSKGSVGARPDSVEMKVKSPRGAMLRSLFVPGGGQFYNGKWLKGVLIAGTEVGLIANAIIQNQFAVQSKTLIEKEFYQNNRGLSIWWLGAVILYSIGDAYVDAHLYKFDESEDLTVKLTPSPNWPTDLSFPVCALTLQYRW